VGARLIFPTGRGASPGAAVPSPPDFQDARFRRRMNTLMDKPATLDRSPDVKAQLRRAAQRIQALESQADAISAVADLLVGCFRGGGKVIFCGNGGSAADSQHLAAEFMGRYLRDRAPLPSLALTVDTSALTAIGNDYGFDEVFARQVWAHGRAGGVLLAISTSGKSPNVLRAAEAAKTLDMTVIALTGGDGGPLASACDICLNVPVGLTPRIQEMHILIGHVLCGLAEDALS